MNIRFYPCLCLLVCLLAGGPAWAQIQDGSSCDNAIPIDASYAGGVPGPGTYWYRAWTYDLPLAITYRPTNPSAAAPVAYIDFTCQPDHYATNELQQIFGRTDSLGRPQTAYVDVPAQMSFNKGDDGSYTLSVPSSYRDAMFRAGLTQDAEAFIRVVVASEASIEMSPSLDFRDCVGEGLDSWVRLGDTLELSAQPEGDETVVFPLSLWRNDSIRFVWTGSEELSITVHFTCEIDPERLGDTYVEEYVVPAGGELRLSQVDVMNLYNMYAELQLMVEMPQGSTQGMYYAYLSRTTAGKLTVERTPVTPVAEGTLPLELDHREKTVTSDQVYYYSTFWPEALKFSTSTNHLVTAYFGTSVPLTEETALLTKSFATTDTTGRFACLTKQEEAALVAAAGAPYIYVRFVADKAIDITPTAWNNVCAQDYAEIVLPDLQTTAYTPTTYRLLYTDISGYDLTLSWPRTDRNSCTVLFSDTCDKALMGNATHRLIQSELTRNSSSVTIPAATISAWSDRVDEDGYIYVRVSSNSRNTVSFATAKPADTGGEDPETCTETEWKPLTKVEQYCDTLLPYKWQVYEGREVMIAEAGMHYDTIFSYLSDGTTRCDSVIYTLSLSTVHCERPAPEPPGTGGGEEEKGEGETGGNENTPNPPTPGPGFPEPNYPTGSVIYRGAQTISAVCVANAGNVTGAADGIVEVRVTKAQELSLMQGSVELERWTQQPGEVHRLTLREGVTYTLRGLETLYLRR